MGVIEYAGTVFLNSDFSLIFYFLNNIQEYGRNLASLGIDAANIPAYCSLWQCVAPSDQQDRIIF